MTNNVSPQVQKLVDDKFNNYQKTLQVQFDIFISELTSQAQLQLTEALASTLGSTGVGGALSGGLGNILNSVLNGKRVDLRSVANSAALGLAPDVASFFNSSSAQNGEGLMDLLSAAQRNF